MDDSDLALLQSITLLKSFVKDLILLKAAHYRERIVVNRSLVEASMELVNRVLFTSRIDIYDSSVKNATDSGSALTLQAHMRNLFTYAPVDKVHATRITGVTHVAERHRCVA